MASPVLKELGLWKELTILQSYKKNTEESGNKKECNEKKKSQNTSIDCQRCNCGEICKKCRKYDR